MHVLTDLTHRATAELEAVMDFKFIPINPEIEITGFHSIYYFEFDKTFYHPSEKHDFWEMVYVDDGCINAIVDGVGIELSKGQVIFHTPMEPHSHIANHRDSSNLVVVSFACNSPLMSFFTRKIFHLEKPSRKILSLFLKESTNAMGAISGDFSNKSPLDFSSAAPGSVQLMQCYLVEFLFSLIRSDDASVMAMQNSRASRSIAESSLANSIVSYIEENLIQTPSLPNICDHFSLSRTYLCRIFREGTGESPIDYWIGLKMKEAKKLIREGNHNITQISDYLGYSSIHHFTRMFKRHTGLSPTAYKTSVKL